MPAIDQLRDKWVRAVATRKTQEDFWDESRPGLFLRVARSGSKTFYYSYRRPGPGPARERPKATLLLGKFAPDDPRPEVRFGLSDAVTTWRAASGRLAEGTDPKPPQAEPVPANTVLRRTGTTNLQRLGFDHLVDPVVNHQPRGVRASYNLWRFCDERRNAMEAWDAHLRSILGL